MEDIARELYRDLNKQINFSNFAKISIKRVIEGFVENYESNAFIKQVLKSFDFGSMVDSIFESRVIDQNALLKFTPFSIESKIEWNENEFVSFFLQFLYKVNYNDKKICDVLEELVARYIVEEEIRVRDSVAALGAERYQVKTYDELLQNFILKLSELCLEFIGKSFDELFEALNQFCAMNYAKK